MTTPRICPAPRLFLLALLALLAPHAARAQTTAPVCWNRTMELIDNTVNNNEGGDQSFFTKVGGSPPMGFLVFANTPAMMALPGFDPTQVPVAERGCAKSSYLNSRTWSVPNPLHPFSSVTSSPTSCSSVVTTTPAQDGNAYDNAYTYPRLDDGCYLNGSYKTVDDIDPTKYYNYRQWTDAGFGTAKSAGTACSGLTGSTEQSACNACFAAGKPYYISNTISASTPNDMVLKGNFLHFFGPSYVGALAAWKNTIAGNAKIIWGHGYYDNNLPGITKGRDPNPACNKFNTDFSTANRASYLNAFSNTPPPASTITKFPLAEALFSVGYFLTDSGRFTSDSTYVRTGTSAWSPNIGGNQDTICAPCQFSAAIVITDGQVSNDTLIHPTVKAMSVATPGDKTKVGQSCTKPSDCPSGTQCVTCADDSSLPCLLASTSQSYCRDTYWADDVASYFARNDVRTQRCGISSTNANPGQSCEPERQYMTTYVINVGAPDNAALRSVASSGNGLYIEAQSAAGIRTALSQVVNDIIRRSTSFSVASVTSVQTRTTTAVFIPRFKPSVLTQWEGHLFRYKLFNENAAGCIQGIDTVAPFDAAKTAKNPNKDGDCADVYIVDKDGSFVGENADGDFMKLDTTATYPWPATSVPAVPLWDGAKTIVAQGSAGRNIYAAVDANQNGTIEPDEQIPFTVANVAKLVDAFALGGVGSDFCQTLASQVGTTFADETTCATYVIRYMRGEDIFDEDSDGDTTDMRQVVLGDIFHSSPQLVVPPLTPFLCELGANKQQCEPALFRTPTPGGDSAYLAYQSAQSGRRQFVLVGSNDGMLHAFEAGVQRTGDDPDTAAVEPSDNKYFDAGSGNELWAFIPPEMLSRLKRTMSSEGHKELVDGSPMVRDVWVDLNKNGQKDYDQTTKEFRTVAITGMRRGGRSYFALDVTDPSTPHFLWSNPPPGSAAALAAGQAWGEFAPRPAPIVPVMAKVANGYQTSNIQIGGVDTREQWSVFLGGGYDQAGLRGRSINVYDAWYGTPIYRFAYQDNTGSSDPRQQLGPVAAAVATASWGDSAAQLAPLGARGYFFDTAVVGDVWGNVWTTRLAVPGEDTNGDGLYDNWGTGRLFETQKGATLANKLPFFEMPSLARLSDSKLLRMYLGAGDRSSIRDQDGGVCSLSNLSACVRKGCSVDYQLGKQNIGSATTSARWNASGASTAAANNSFSATGATPACGVVGEASVAATINCGTNGTGTYSYGMSCATGTEPCTSLTPKPLGIQFPFTGTTLLNRFYSVRVFDATRLPFTARSDATAYDTARLTDSDLAVPSGATPTYATTTSAGYVVPYAGQNERTSGAAFVPGGPLVYWNTLTPAVASTQCGRNGNDQALLYQAHSVTGGTSGTTGTNVDLNNVAVARSTSGGTVFTPPPTIISQKIITPSGVVVSVGLTIAPGTQPPTAMETGRADLYSPIEVIEIDRKTHDCRHGSPAKCD